MDRAEERLRSPPVQQPRPLLGLDRRADHTPPLPSGASVRELLPAVVQTLGEVARRSQKHQALQAAGPPYDRLMREDSIGEQVKEELNEYRAGLDPVELLRSSGRHSPRWQRCPLRRPRMPHTVRAPSVSWPGLPFCGSRVNPSQPLSDYLKLGLVLKGDTWVVGLR